MNRSPNLQRLLSVILFMGNTILVSHIAVANELEKPNVVIFYADDLGWGDLSINNTDVQYFRHTPRIDHIFTHGIVLDNYVTHAVCSPSRAGLLTAKHYTKVMAGPRTGGELPFDSESISLGHDFQNSGYITGCFGKWHNSEPNVPANQTGKLVGDKNEIIPDNDIYEYEASKHFGIGVNKYGFDNWAGYYGGGTDMFNRFALQQNQANWWVDSVYMGAEEGYTTDLITNAALQFIENNKDNKFLCYVPQQAVHHPIHIKKSDLQEYCEKLATDRGIPGQWDFVKNIKSPSTGKTIEQAGEELKCYIGDEFDVTKIDPNKTHFNHLIFGAYIYSLDKSVGSILDKLEALGLMDKTIILFASDNGGLPEGCSLPFKGGKHSIWEGGVHVPAAIWWPGKFDSNKAPYSEGNNKFEGNVGYFDLYPTLMAMAGNTLNVINADGVNFWENLKTNTQVRTGYANPFFEMWDDHGFVRTDQWKLMYSESAKRAELYHYKTDIAETQNVASSNPTVTQDLIDLYKAWLNENKLAVPFVRIDSSNLHSVKPNPEGEILEVKAWQNKMNNSGVFIRFAKGDYGSGGIGHYIEPGDRVEYDIYVADDSKNTKGMYYSSGASWAAVFDNSNGINQDGINVHSQNLSKGKWIRNVVGTGTICPGTSTVNYIVFRNGNPGYYHFYLDNIVIRKSDGSVRTVIWQQGADAIPIIYRFKNVNHNSLSDAKKVSDFPFSDIQLSPLMTNADGLVLPIKKFIFNDYKNTDQHEKVFEIQNFSPQNVAINSIVLGGDAASFFEITEDEVSGSTIPPMGEKSFKVNYNPKNSGGNHKAFFAIENELVNDTIWFLSHYSANTIYRKIIDHCDVSTKWGSNNGLSVNNEEHKEWGACLESEGKETNEFKKTFDPPINTQVTVENGYLQFWYYVSDKSKFEVANQVEIGSGGKNDQDEYNWNIHAKVTDGWNLLQLKFSEAGVSPAGATPDLGAINWIRIYHKKNGSLVTRIDGIQVIDSTVVDEHTANSYIYRSSSADLFSIKVFPNPASDVIYIEMDDLYQPHMKVDLIDLHGRVVMSKMQGVKSQFGKTTLKMSLCYLLSGNYFVQIHMDGHIYTKPFLIKK